MASDDLVHQFYAAIDEMQHVVNLDNAGIQVKSMDLVEQLGRPDGLSLHEAITEFRNYALKHQISCRAAEQESFFNLAHAWASMPNVSTIEACHGVARELYLKHHEIKGPPTVIGQEYNELFNERYADKIRERTIRAAHDLFDGTSRISVPWECPTDEEDDAA